MMKGLPTAAVVLGLSLGGFFDGIVLHQVLQWHHMLRAVDDPAISGNLALNITADGFFHVATWVLAVLGIVLLWRARAELVAPGSGRRLAGGILAGAGLFNLVEGVIDHHLLGLHHVRTDVDNVLLWDLGFLAVGAVLVVVGVLLALSARRPA